MNRSLIDRLGERIAVTVIERVQTGSPEPIAFTRESVTPNTPGAAVILVRRHMPLARAHRLLTDLMAKGVSEPIVAKVPMVEDLAVLQDELREMGIGAVPYRAPANVDVKAIRKQTGLSQRKFALSFCLDENTVKNWEQGRTKPDSAARALLTMISVDPGAVRDILAKAVRSP